MNTNDSKRSRPSPKPKAGNTAKIMADLPGDASMREQLQERKENDGFPGSCGI